MRIATLFCLSFLLASETLGSHENDSEMNSDRPYVTCFIQGGIGNELFEVATTLAYAWDNDAIAVFPELNYHPQDRDRVFFRVNTFNPPRPLTSYFHESTWHSSSKIPFQRDLKLNGYLQSWMRFDHHREKIQEIFSPSADTVRHLNEQYAHLINNPKTVALHVRTYSATLHNMRFHPFLGIEYYEKAMQHFPSDTLFVVFSDRINWCKKHFAELDASFIFIEEHDAINELYLMSMMQHNIIANSTFSWWGAYLNKNPDKIVIAPSSVMHPSYYAYPLRHPNEFFLPDWILIDPEFKDPYPTDMTHYDAHGWD